MIAVQVDAVDADIMTNAVVIKKIAILTVKKKTIMMMTCNLNFIKLKGEDYTSSLYIYYFFSIECFWIGYPISLMYVMGGEDFDKDKKEFDLIVVLLFQNIKILVMFIYLLKNVKFMI